MTETDGAGHRGAYTAPGGFLLEACGEKRCEGRKGTCQARHIQAGYLAGKFVHKSNTRRFGTGTGVDDGIVFMHGQKVAHFERNVIIWTITHIQILRKER